MKPLNKYERKYKEFLKLRDELDEIDGKIRSLPWIPLEKPVHRGWDVSFELRKDISNRMDSHFLQQVLDIGYSTSHIRNVYQVKMMRAGKEGYWDKSKWVSFRPSKLYLRKDKYEKLHPAVQKYFYCPRWWDIHYKQVLRDHYIAELPYHWTVLKVRPHFHTHYRDKDSVLESRRTWLRQRLEYYWKIFGYSYSKSYPAHKDRARIRSAISKFTKGETEDIPHEKIPLIYEF